MLSSKCHWLILCTKLRQSGKGSKRKQLQHLSSHSLEKWPPSAFSELILAISACTLERQKAEAFTKLAQVYHSLPSF